MINSFSEKTRYNPLVEIAGWKIFEAIYDNRKHIRLSCPCGHTSRSIIIKNWNNVCVHHRDIPEAVLVTVNLIK